MQAGDLLIVYLKWLVDGNGRWTRVWLVPSGFPMERKAIS